jgi:hypothetical protein
MTDLKEILNNHARKLQWLIRKMDSERKGKPYKNDKEYSLELFQISRELLLGYEEIHKVLK